MIAFLLMLPVASTLVWLYWYCLPIDATRNGRWRLIDTGLLLTLFVLASAFVYIKMNTEYVDAGPIWHEVVAVTGAYLIFAIGLSIGLIARRRFAKNQRT